MLTIESLETRIAEFATQISADEILRAEYEATIRSTQALYVETNSRLDRNKRAATGLELLKAALAETYELPTPEVNPTEANTIEGETV